MFNIFKNKNFIRLVDKYQHHKTVKKTLQRLKSSENASIGQVSREYGRSMIEMIGVLVIIGLLSSAGVIGYKSAHDTYRATGIMDTVMKGKLAMDANSRALALTSDSNAESMLKRAMENSSIIVEGDTVSVTERQIGSKTYKIFTIDTTENAGVCEKIVGRRSLYESSDANDVNNITIHPENMADCGEEGEVAMQFSFNVFVPKSDFDRENTPGSGGGKLEESKCEAPRQIVDGDCICPTECDRGDDKCICCNEGSEWNEETNACQCPAGSHNTGSGCITCSAGQTWDGNACINTCPSGKVWNGSSCVCADGTYDNGSACVTCSSPKTRWDTELNKCTCPTGQIEIGDTCEPKAVCTGPKTDYRELTNTCHCPADKPFWRDPDCIACPTGATYNDETQTCDCPDEQVFNVEKNKCTLSCGEYQTYDETLEKCVCDTEIIGMIETPNSAGVCVCDEERGFVSTPSNGQCLCDTRNKNFAPTPNENGQCVCANAGDYMAPGGAGCYSCVNTTVEWCNRNFAEGVAACDTINTDVWYCKHYKNVKWDSNYNGEYAPAYYNPSTKAYCEPTQVLFKNSSGNYECGSCDRIRPDNTVEIDGVCVCAAGQTYDGSKCVSTCGAGDYAYYTEEGIACAPCFQQYVYMNSTCHDTPEASLCDSDVNNGLEAGQTGYRYFWWNTWKKNTPATCRAGLNISPTSSGECSWENGCTIKQEDLPYCADNAEITSECQCYTGGNIGEICCAPGAYYANESCVTCPTGQVPNEDKTGCKECEHNQLYINNMCETPCSEDQDAYLIEMTSSTSYRYGCCAAGLSGGYAEDDEGNNGITCCEEGSNYQHITQGGKDVYACCKAGSNLDAIVSNGTVLAKACCSTGSDLEALINNDTDAVIASGCCATDTSIRAIYYYEEGNVNLSLIGANCIPDYFCTNGYIVQTQENYGTANVNCLTVN